MPGGRRRSSWRMDVTPLFADDAAIRRVSRERALVLAGGAALLMQVAHPLVAAGVGDHSAFARDPWPRLLRTLDALYGIVFGTTDDAARIGASVQVAHARVHGVLAQAAGPFPAGTAYRADDPELLLWVHSTLVHAAIAAHELLVGPLAADDREAFHADMRVVGEVFGVPAERLHPSFAAHAAYISAMVTGPTLVVSDGGRMLARTILAPPAPRVLHPALRAAGTLTAGLLPVPLRERYGIPWQARHRHAFALAASSSRRLLPLVPGAIRHVPLGVDGPRPLPRVVRAALR